MLVTGFSGRRTRRALIGLVFVTFLALGLPLAPTAMAVHRDGHAAIDDRDACVDGDAGKGNDKKCTPTSTPPAPLDTVAPTTTATLPASTGTAPWYNVSPVVGTLSCTDTAGTGVTPTGCAATFYSIDRAAYVEGASFSVAGDGLHEVRYYSTDAAGNAEPASLVNVGIDLTVPSVQFETTCEAGSQAGWCRGPVSVTTFPSDGPSGVSSVACTLNGTPIACSALGQVPYPVTADGTYDVAAVVTDLAGNVFTSSPLALRVDATAPMFDVHSDVAAAATSASGAIVSYIAPTATDAGSGVTGSTGSVTCDPASGAAFKLGTTPIICTVFDVAGNPATRTVFNVIVSDTTAPIAAADAYAGFEDMVLSVAQPGVLANDEDYSPLTAQLVAGPTHGTLTLNADGSFIYTPSANYNGLDSFTYRATDGTQSSATTTVTMTLASVGDPQVPSALAFSTTPPAAHAGRSFTTTVRIIDDEGNTVQGATNAITLSRASGAGTLSGTLTRNAVDGVATFDDLSLSAAGDHSLGATSALLTSATGPTFSVVGDATQLSIGTVPSSLGSLQTFSTQVRILDAEGRLVFDATDSVTLFRDAGPFGGLLGGLRTRSPVGGIVTFSDLTLDRVGTYRIAATASGLTTSKTGDITIVPGTATGLRFGAVPSTPVSGSQFATTVRVVDAAGNTVDSSSLITVSKASGTGTLTGGGSRNAVRGVATFDALAITGTGLHTIRATADGLAADASPAIHVQPLASTLVFVGMPTSVTSGAAFAMGVQISDADGQRVPGATRTVTLAAVGPGLLYGPTSIDAVDGLASFTGLFFDKAGSYAVTTASDGLTSATSTVTVVAGPGVRLAFETLPSAAQTGTPFTVVLRILDANGNVATTSHTVTLVKDSASSSGTLTGTTVRVVSTGTGTFDDLVLGAAGSYRLKASGPGLSPTTSAFFTVNPSTLERLDHITVLPNPATVPAATATRFTATGYDADGNILAGLAYTFSVVAEGSGEDPAVGHVYASGDFVGIKVGTAHVRAQAGTIIGSAAVQVTPGPLAYIDVVPSASAVGVDVSLDFTVKGRDVYGNTAPIPGTVVWSIDGVAASTLASDAVFVAPGRTAAGSYTVRAQSAGLVGTAIVHVTSTSAAAGSVTSVASPVVESSVSVLINGEPQTIFSSAYSVGLAEAAPDSTVRLVPPADAEGSSSMLSGADITLERASRNVAITIETQVGGLSVPPPEVDVSHLLDQLVELASPAEPGLYIHVAATEGGEPLPSARLNDLVGRIEMDFQVPVSYFTTNGLDPTRTRLVEYSDGAAVVIDIFPTLVSPLPDAQGRYLYHAVLERFSTFALVGLALSTPSASGNNGISSPTIVTATLLPTVVPVVPLVPPPANSVAPASSIPVASATAAPTASLPAPLPTGVDLVRFIDPATEPVVPGTANTATISDPLRTVQLRFVDGQWVAQRLELLNTDGAYMAALASFDGPTAIVVDYTPPQLAIEAPEGVVYGVFTVRAGATDNLGISRVEFWVDGELRANLKNGPYDITLKADDFEAGTHSIRIVAYDAVGNVAEEYAAAKTISTPGSALGATALTRGLGSDEETFLLAMLGLFAALALGGAGVTYIRTRWGRQKLLSPYHPLSLGEAAIDLAHLPIPAIEPGHARSAEEQAAIDQAVPDAADVAAVDTLGGHIAQYQNSLPTVATQDELGITMGAASLVDASPSPATPAPTGGMTHVPAPWLVVPGPLAWKIECGRCDFVATDLDRDEVRSRARVHLAAVHESHVDDAELDARLVRTMP